MVSVSVYKQNVRMMADVINERPLMVVKWKIPVNWIIDEYLSQLSKNSSAGALKYTPQFRANFKPKILKISRSK